MELLGKIFKQTSFQILGKIVSSLSTFIILGVIARNYKEEGTGVFTLSLTYLTIFFLIGDFGFNGHMLRKSQIEWQKLLGTRLIWSVVLMVFAIGLLPFLPFVMLDFSQAVIFGSLAILGSGVFVTCNLIFQKQFKYNLSVSSSSIGILIYLFLVLFLSQNKTSLSYLTISFALGWIFIAIISLLLVRKFVKSLIPIFDFGFTRKLLKDSWPIAATLCLNVVYFRADSFLIAYFGKESQVGIYNLAYQVFQSVLVLPAFIMNAYYPLMLKSLTGLKWVALGLLGFSSIGTAVTLLFAPLLIKLLTGGGFAGSSESLQILSLGYPAYFLSSLLMWLLITKGEYKKLLLIYTSGVILNLFLNFLYIPQYSFFAASWITVISEYVILIMQVITLRGILLR